MLRSHETRIIPTFRYKQIRPLEFQIVAKFANQRYTFNGKYKEFGLSASFSC